MTEPDQSPPSVPETAPATEKPPEEKPLDLTEEQGRRIDFIWSALMLGMLAGLFQILSLFRGVSIPVLLALSLAYALNPIVSILAEKNVSRVWGTTIVFFLLSMGVFGGILYMIPVVREEATKVPSFLERATVALFPWLEQQLGISVPEFLRQRAAELGDEAATLAQSAGPTMVKWLGTFASNTARVITALLGLLVVPVLGFFFLMDYPQIINRLEQLIPLQAKDLVTRRFRQIDEVLSAFVRGQLVVGLILSGTYSLGLSLARVDMAIVIGLVAGFGNMVPYVGTGVGIVLSLLGLILNWQAPWQIAVIASTFIVGQLLESLVITPRVVGAKVGLPPVIVIIAVLGFGEIFGFVGILLAVPTAAVLKVVLTVVVQRYLKMPVYLGTASTHAPD